MFTCTQCHSSFTPSQPKRGYVPPFCSHKCFGQSLRDKVKDRTEKKCCRCKVVLPLSSFCIDNSKPDRHSSWCKECHYQHRTSPSGRVAHDRYRASEKGKAASARSVAQLRSDPLKYAAHTAVNVAVAKGRMRQLPCEVCGKTRTVAHHDDYTKPLDVRWLCQRHHMAVHAKGSS